MGIDGHELYYLAIVLDNAEHSPTRETAAGVVGFLRLLGNKTSRTSQILNSFMVC